MSYFFSRSATEDGRSGMGSAAAHMLLEKLIREEDKAHPLSDQKLADI